MTRRVIPVPPGVRVDKANRQFFPSLGLREVLEVREVPPRVSDEELADYLGRIASASRGGLRLASEPHASGATTLWAEMVEIGNGREVEPPTSATSELHTYRRRRVNSLHDQIERISARARSDGLDPWAATASLREEYKAAEAYVAELDRKGRAS